MLLHIFVLYQIINLFLSIYYLIKYYSVNNYFFIFYISEYDIKSSYFIYIKYVSSSKDDFPSK